MCNSKFNAERYYDPTPFEAIKNIDRQLHAYRPLVYICSPFAGDIEGNVKRARQFSRFAVEKGYIPIAPHLLFPQFLDDSKADERELGLFFGNVLMSKCSEVWVCGDTVSCGMAAEMERAKRKNYKVRYFNSEMKEVNADA